MDEYPQNNYEITRIFNPPLIVCVTGDFFSLLAYKEN